MKQSKYSKRRPSSGAVYSQVELDRRQVRKPVIAKNVFKPIKEYDLGIFLDDMRTMDDVHLPEAKEWVVLRSYHEFADYFENFQRDDVTNMCISFDHYLGDRKPHGDDCYFLFLELRPDIRIDIGGHSQDNVKNTDKTQHYESLSPRLGNTFSLN